VRNLVNINTIIFASEPINPRVVLCSIIPLCIEILDHREEELSYPDKKQCIIRAVGIICHSVRDDPVMREILEDVVPNIIDSYVQINKST